MPANTSLMAKALDAVRNRYRELKMRDALETKYATPIPRMSDKTMKGVMNAEMGGIFVGPEESAIKAAEQLEAQGADKGQIWRQLNMFRGADNKWRTEIPDNTSTFDPRLAAASPNGAYQDYVLQHPELYNKYPDLKDINVSFNPHVLGNASYEYNAGYPQIKFAPEMQHVPNLAHSSNLHELQHAIQGKEGWATGGSPTQFERLPYDKEHLANAMTIRELADKWGMTPDQVVNSNLPPAYQHLANDSVAKAWANYPKDIFKKMEDAYLANRDPYQAYHNLAGEVEARNTQFRQMMTPEQRMLEPPWQTQDVPYAQQIVRRGEAPISLLLQALH